MSRIALSSQPTFRALIPPWLSGRWGMAGLSLILYTIGIIALPHLHWGGEELIGLIESPATLLALLLQVLLAWRVALQKQFDLRTRRAWFLFGLGAVLSFLGDATWGYLVDVLKVEPFPSAADIFYLAAYSMMFWALSTMPGARLSRNERVTFWFNLLVMLTSASMFVGYFVIIPTASISTTSLIAKLLAIAYPVYSLLIMASAISLLLRLPETETRSVLLLLLAGIGCFLASDLAFGYASLAGTYTAGNWIDAGWHLARAFMVLAALRQMYQGSVPPAKPHWIRLLNNSVKKLPMLTIVLGHGLALYLLVRGDGQAVEFLMACALLLTLLVIARQISSPEFADYPVRAKMIMTFIAVSVLAVILVSASAYLTIRSSLETVAGESLQAEVEIRSKLLASEMSKQVDLMEGFVLGETIEYGVQEASAHYDGDATTIKAELVRQDRAWRTALDPESLAQGVLNNSMSQELADFGANLPNHSDLLLTDAYGAVIAATVRPDNYSQAAESWWQSAYDLGRGAVYISQPIYDPTTRDYQVTLAIPVRSDHGQDVIGVFSTTFDLQNILDTLTPTDRETQAGFSLLLPDGRLLDLHGDTRELAPEIMTRLQADGEARPTALDFEGTKQLLTQARLTSSDPRDVKVFQGLNWILLAHKKSSVIIAPLHAASRTVLIATLIVLMFTSGIAVLLTQLLIAPISRLTTVASKIAMGDLSTQAQIESRDEIGTLASTFNTMLETLSRTQKELQESEALYRSLVDSSPDMIAVHRDGKYLFINQAGVELLGVNSPDEIVGRQIVDILPMPDRELDNQGIEYVHGIKESTPFIQQKMHRPNGMSFEAEFRAIPISYAGEPAVQFVMRDITERKEAQEKIHQLLAQVARQRDELEIRVEQRTSELNALNQRLQEELAERQRLVQSLREHERQLSQTAVMAKIAYSELDLITDELTFNDQFYSLIRTSAEKVGGYVMPVQRYLHEFVHPDDISRITEPIQAAKRSAFSTGQLEYRCICGDGQIQQVLIEFQVEYDKEGRPSRVFNTHMDVTERYELVQSLRESEEQFRLLFEASPDAILLIDPNDPKDSWTILDCNEAACTMNGYTRNELIGQSIDVINAKLQQPVEHAEYLKQIREKGILHYEAIHRNKVGHLFPVEVSTSIITFGGRELVLGIDRDITERKQAELALKVAKDAAEESQRVAEEASRAKSEFLSRMSHELRTPMNAILGFAQLLDMSHKEPLSPTQKERVKQIVKGGQHLLDLINEILDISRIEANRLQISPEPVSVRDSVQEVLDLTAPLAVKRHIQIVTRLGRMEVNPFVMADRQRLKQVLLNLLGNAVKYNFDGGSVIVSCESTPAKHWRISIADTGPGIPEDQHDRLFLPFERLVSEQSNVEGTGLGLTLAKHLVELMHGQIGVDSVPGRGSTFWIELPPAERPLERLQRTGNTGGLHAVSATTRTILYVEDNVANFELIQQVFADYSQLKLVWAADAKTGLEAAREHHPNLILLDLHLGGKDGAELLQQLKEKESTAAIPVVVVSADATSGQARRLTSLGAHSYLTKPLDVKHFVQVVEELLNENEINHAG